MDAAPHDPASKDAARSQFAAVRRQRSAAEIAAARTSVCSHVLTRAAAVGWRCVAGYVPLRTEPGSLDLLAGLRAAGVHVLVPVVLADRDLDWAQWTSHGCWASLGKHAIGAADAVLVPASAVARDGTRLGRGGGSYDRALPRRAPRAVVAALLFDDELVAALPCDPWDVAVDAVVTPAAAWTQVGRNTGNASTG